MASEILTIRCFDACIFKLSFPDFLLKNPVSTGKKLFGFLFQFAEDFPENRETISFLQCALPNLVNLEKAFVQGTRREKGPLKAEKLLEAFNAAAIKQGKEGCTSELW